MQGMIAAEVCQACGHISLEKRGFCNRCGSRDMACGTCSGRGILWSQSTIYRPPSTEGGSGQPYTIGMIKLEAGPRIMAVVPADLHLGDEVMIDRPSMESPPLASRPPIGAVRKNA